MRLTITTRIFLALTIVSIVILALNAAVTRWSFQDGFLDYIAQQELETIEEAVERLIEMHRRDGNWQALHSNPRRWNELLRQSNDRPPPKRPPRGAGRSDHRPPPHDPLELGRRTSLVSTNGERVVGRERNVNTDQSVPITVDGEIVGYVLIAPQRRLTNQIDQNFASEQERSIYLVALAALLFAAAISAFLARQLTQPVRAMAKGARSITAGNIKTRIAVSRRDELGDLANDLNQLAETLEKNQASRQRWVADIAHELRTPLAVLRGELEAIEDGIRAFNEATRKSLQAEVGRLTKLVGDLHDLSAYDGGSLEYRRERTNVGALLHDVLDNAENRLRDAGIVLTRQITGNHAEVNADSTRLEQLFVNLLENTIRYTDTPGILRVAYTVMADTVELDFADSAPGVTEHEMKLLFDRLFRVDTSRSRNSGGSGLGLSICKAIVEAHQGTLQAMPSDAGGLLIRICLPVVGVARQSQ